MIAPNRSRRADARPPDREARARVLYAAFDVVPSPKGAATHISHFVRGLSAGGYEVRLLTPGDGELPAAGRWRGATITRIPPLPEATLLVRALDFRRAVGEHIEEAQPYQVVHFRSPWEGLAATSHRARRGHRTLYEVNGLPSVELPVHYPGLRGTEVVEKLREQELATLAASDRVICPSRVTREYLETLGVPAERLRVIPNGVSPRLFRRTPPPPLGDRPLTLLYVGTLAEWQGLNDLLDALPLLPPERPVLLRIVGRGRGRQRKALAKRVAKLGLAARVSLEEAVPHHRVPDLIAGAHLCVAPLSLGERNLTQGCCPIKILEYMAVGRPVVATDIPVVREILRPGRDGLLFAPGDPEDLVRQILRLADDPGLAGRLGDSAAERARTTFTWGRAQERLAAVYEELLGTAAGPAGRS